MLTAIAGTWLVGPITTASAAAATTELGCTTNTVSITSSTWSYRACQVPDIDQRRAGLPNNGNMYCLPTSTLNVLFWLDKRGYPNLLTGNFDPMSNTPRNYNEVTAKLGRLGRLAETDPSSGTGRSDTVSAIEDLIEEKGYEDDLGADWEELDDVEPVSRRLVELTRNGSDFLIASIGKYDNDGDRVGGHAVTIVGARGSGDGRESVTFHDPWTDSDLYTQSAVAAPTYVLGEDDGNGAEVLGYGSTTVTARLEGVIVVTTAP
ncbi:hypothetical protein [Streptomyces xantholiticus]|uniref:hypothetical protein n=1 Tax=Streptomyces xantholiticus TaxID=68285 RepID=UPI00167B70C3|nr:hypothetical protein [Streptomyces xantholiticus]GGW69795.1 hypothetical protein GCM10010381_63210 [Streptomyces xantholiticus]